MKNQTIKNDPDNRDHNELTMQLRSIWLGCEFLNGTFMDDDFELLPDISDIEALLTSFEDEPCLE